jgi:serine/threonine protein kinase
MPIATPIAEALEGLPLEGVVQAMATIANTLERLERELNVAHRDIKPGNLYRLDGEYLIGDFGLIALHDALPLTGNGRQVGPAHFTAYEMILDPSSADPHRADVYSLGKTLWVLATGQRFPPEGHQPVGMRKFEVGDFRPHPRSHALDQEVDLMTRLSPEGRPSKQQVARDLAAWVELTSEAPVIDVSEARMRLRAKIDRAMNAQDAEDQYKNLAHEAARRLQELVRPINDELRRLHPRTKTDVMNDKLTSNVLKRHEYPKRVIWDWRRCTIVAAFEGPMATTLRVARGLELLDDGTLHLYLTVHVGPEGTFGSDFHWSYRGVTTARVGSVEAELMLDIGVKELATAATQAVEIFVDRLPDLNGMN